MPSIQQSRFYNSPELGAAFSSLAQAFAPPTGSDLASYAVARKTRLQADALERANGVYSDPSATADARDAAGILAGLFNPTQSYRALSMDDATKRYGVDVGATTAIRTNAADNARALNVQRLQDAAALERAQASNTKDITTSLLAPVGQGQTRFVPPSIAGMFGLPSTQVGTLNAGQGDLVVTPDGRTISGQAKPLSETEWQAAQNERLRQSGQFSDQMLLDAIAGKQIPVEAIGPDGKTPIFMTPGAATREGARPYDKPTASTVINNGPNGVPYGEPEKGLVWARNPDGSVRLDERGAPVAIPYQGGSAFKAQEDAARANEAKDASASTKRDVVLQDLDRALASIGNNPALTTGLGAQLTGGIGGTPARNVAALLDSVRANIGFDQLQQMRDASPTGGALGQVTEKEQSLLQSVLGSLETTQDQQQLSENLRRLRNIYLEVVHGPGNGPPREQLSFDAPAAPAAEHTAINPQTGERLVLRNGAWEPVQ
jgi:hypothetical protein